jgi:hypothetical protein
MDSTLVTALVGAIATVASSAIAVVTTRLLTNPLSSGDNSDQAALLGRWVGYASQDGVSSAYHISFTIKRVGRMIRGEGHVELKCSKPKRQIDEDICFIGGFLHNRYLQLNYKAENQPGIVQFGSATLELNPNGQELQGRFLGYGPRYTRGWMTGTILLQRQVSVEVEKQVA